MKTEFEVLEAKVKLLNQVIEVQTNIKDDLEKENKELKEHEKHLEDNWQRLYRENEGLKNENEQLALWLEEETLRLQETEDYCQDLYAENKELKKDNERLTMTTNNNYELMKYFKDRYHELLENVNNLINKYEKEQKCHMASAYGKIATEIAYPKAGDCDDCK